MKNIEQTKQTMIVYSPQYYYTYKYFADFINRVGKDIYRHTMKLTNSEQKYICRDYPELGFSRIFFKKRNTAEQFAKEFKRMYGKIFSINPVRNNYVTIHHRIAEDIEPKFMHLYGHYVNEIKRHILPDGKNFPRKKFRKNVL